MQQYQILNQHSKEELKNYFAANAKENYALEDFRKGLENTQLLLKKTLIQKYVGTQQKMHELMTTQFLLEESSRFINIFSENSLVRVVSIVFNNIKWRFAILFKILPAFLATCNKNLMPNLEEIINETKNLIHGIGNF